MKLFLIISALTSATWAAVFVSLGFGLVIPAATAILGGGFCLLIMYSCVISMKDLDKNDF